jgi:trehalose 6-phosphate phosphatase
MRILRPGVDPEAFFELVRRAPARALLLDYDGTLAPFTPDRDRAWPYPGVRPALERILRAGGTRLAVVSGRAAGDVARLLGTEPLPELWGSHGLERWLPGGERRAAAGRPAADAFLQDAVRWIEERGWAPMLERKPFGIALHARGADAGVFEAARRAFRDRLLPASDSVGLEPLEFDGGIELRPAGRHKGEVVREILGETGPGAGVAYLGDDRTDEDAFAALRDHGLGVLVRAEIRPTAADLWIRPPAELIDFLGRWSSAAENRG